MWLNKHKSSKPKNDPDNDQYDNPKHVNEVIQHGQQGTN